MTPKKKADELVERFSDYSNYYKRGETGFLEWSTKEGETNAIQCAIICVEDELELLSKIHSKLKEIGDGRNRLYLVSLMAENESVLNELKSRL